MADDWLSLEPPRVPDSVLHHEPVAAKNAGKNLPRRHEGNADGARRELALLRRRFSLAQRAYIDAMVQCRFNRSNAGKALVKAGFTIEHDTRKRWNKRPDFQRALQLAEELMMTELGINPGRVLLRNEQIVEHAMEEVELRTRNGLPILNADGQPVTVMRDAELAFKANAKAGEHFRLWGDDDKAARVTINVVDLTGTANLGDEAAVLDGTAERVG